MMRHFIILVLSLFVFVGCEPKKNIIQEVYDNQEVEIKNDAIIVEKRIFYVGPFQGINLRSGPSLAGNKITLLPQYTKLYVLERSANEDTIDGLRNYWYKVNAHAQIGWVFGAYLISNINSINIELEKPVLINESGILQFPDLEIVKIWENCHFYDIDYIKIYDSSNKEANYNEIYNEKTMLLKLQETDDWLYLITQDFEKHGFIFIYDISEKSFYGDFEENEKSFNFYRMLLKEEYEIIKKYKNIKRYGPLLEIYFEHNVIKLWDSFSGEVGSAYQILDYYPEYDEVLIREQYYEGSFNFIYNLRLADFTCKIGSIPYFNDSRDTVFSLYGIYGDDIMTIVIFSIADGYYKKLKEAEIFRGKYIDTVDANWINNREIKIDCGDAGILLIKWENNDFQFSYSK